MNATMRESSSMNKGSELRAISTANTTAILVEEEDEAWFTMIRTFIKEKIRVIPTSPSTCRAIVES
jgi:hypothetical protein